MKIAIMQPTFLPWAGYFDLIDQVDAFIYLDNVPFSRQSWQQRNRVRTQAGLTWISLPVTHSLHALTTIAEATVADIRPIQKARLTIAHAYAKAAHAARELPWIDEWLAGIEIGQSLADVNIAFIDRACARLAITTPRHRASALPAREERTLRLVDLCKALGATTYLSPLGSADYLETEGGAFTDAGIELCFQNYAHPLWRQPHQPFTAYAAVIDLLLNEGDGALEILRDGRRETLTPQSAYALAHDAIDQAV